MEGKEGTERMEEERKMEQSRTERGSNEEREVRGIEGRERERERERESSVTRASHLAQLSTPGSHLASCVHTAHWTAPPNHYTPTRANPLLHPFTLPSPFFNLPCSLTFTYPPLYSLILPYPIITHSHVPTPYPFTPLPYPFTLPYPPLPSLTLS